MLAAFRTMKKPAPLFLLLLFPLLFAPLLAFPADERPNFLFLLADDQRPDTIAALGNDRISTPNLDELLARGMSFSRATCSNPICVASRAEILTGRHGWRSGIRAIRGDRLREDEVTWWGDALRAGGYTTWYVGKWHTAGNVLNRGFDAAEGLFGSGGGQWWEDAVDWKGFPITGYRGWVFREADSRAKFPEMGVGLTPEISSHFADAAIRVLEKKRDPEKPFFLTVNFTAPHDPLFVPPGLEGKYDAEDMELPENFAPWHPFDHGNFGGRDEALLAWPRTPEAVKDMLRVYYSVIDDLDAQAGRILAALEESGEMENTYVIYSSDHGMSVGSHGLRGKQNMYEHTINVPLLVAGPGIEAGTSTDAQVYLRELYPTTCELAGLPAPEKIDGKSFAPVLRGERDRHHESIHGYFRNSQRMVRREDGWKLIHYPEIGKDQLFQVEEDPHETNDLAGKPEHQEIEESLRREMQQWREETGDPLLTDDGG